MPKVQEFVKGKLYKIFRPDGTYIYVDKRGRPMQVLTRYVKDGNARPKARKK